MPRPRPEHIGVVLSRLISELGWRTRYDQERLVQQWPEIVGEAISRRAKATRLEHGKLYVSVDRATWRNELMLRKNDILRKVNAAARRKIVSDIIFR